MPLYWDIASPIPRRYGLNRFYRNLLGLIQQVRSLAQRAIRRTRRRSSSSARAESRSEPAGLGPEVEINDLSIVAAGRTSLPNANLAERERNIVINDNYILCRRSEAIENRRHRGPLLFIYVCGLTSTAPVRGSESHLKYRSSAALVHANILARRKPIQNAKANIVVRAGVFVAGDFPIHDKPHQTDFEIRPISNFSNLLLRRSSSSSFLPS